ncbi:MAG: nucleic-acid-binding protein [Novosphingobium sp. 12-64-8]|nr:MAG: nucleic-acid-binding protein [Novosphingobium sp. 12-64-8]
MRIPRNDPLRSDIARGGPAGATLPERKCVLTGRHDARGELVRLAISPEGQVLPDALARAPGRGAWIGVSRADLEKAIANGKLKGALARAFKGVPILISSDLGERAEVALTRALTDRLGIEMRAGSLLLGTERIAQAARAGAVVWLGHASDVGSDGPNKLAQAWRVGEGAEGSGLKGVILPLDRAALSVALGRDNVVHLALTDAAAAERVAAPLGRLLHFLGRDSEAADDGAADKAVPEDSAKNDVFDTKGE